MIPRQSCAILVPAHHAIEPHCELSLRQLESIGYPVRRLHGFSQIDVARNRLASDTLAEGFDALMWIDADMAFLPSAVDRLREHGLAVVCGVYPKKIERALTSVPIPGTASITFGEQGGLIELRYAATGFLYTTRQVYLDVRERQGLPVCNVGTGRPIVPYFLPMVVDDEGGHRYLAEDFAFSERVRRSGHRIWADTTIRLQHIGLYGYDWDDLLARPARSASLRLDIGP